jgi:phthiocerol/phenolphthiocerol synthesis type-I polyketide synthase C
MACRLPGGIDTPSHYWELLRNGTEVVGDLPRDRWDIRAWHHPDPASPGKSYATKGGFRENLDLFDADFFGISPREASRMDPQQRLLLEMTWEALEDAGQVPESLAGASAAVIFGISSLDYQNLQLLDPESVDAYSNVGCAASIAANRVSYFFDFRGPSFILDTACSSSLVALNAACEAIWGGRSALAVAGGANVLLSPFPWVGFSKARMLSPQGRCRVFDQAADGYVRSEGGGVVVLKPLDRARADGDPIRAVILASATNTDGRTQGLFMPSARAQEALLQDVYASAGVAPERVSYVEAHGTGTAVGDPIECEGLGAVLGAGRREPLLIGSVKTNLGHLEAASGIAGAIKTILSLQHREIPASLHFETPNPRIPFGALNLEVVTRHTSLAERPGTLVMGVNSFGFGGANAHIVFEEYRTPAESGGERTPGASEALPLFLSARSPEALRATAANHARYLAEPERPSLYDICRTAAIRRAHHTHRLAVFGRSAEELAEQLTAFAEGAEAAGVVSETTLPGRVDPVFVFSGNGSQWPGMGRELMRESPVFRATVERADREFRPLAGWSLSAALLGADGDDGMARTEVAQPLLFAVQAGLTELLAAAGVKPRAVVGHSVGEVAAAWASGIYSLDQALHVIHARSDAQARTAGRGRMAACGLATEQAAAVLSRYGGALDVASMNSPSSTTISGEAAALAALGEELTRQGVFFRPLELDYPFHSRLMDDVREPLLEELKALRPGSARIRFVSTTTGGELRGGEMNAEYWWRNVRRPVLFGQALELLIRDGHTLFVEVGPHPVLHAYIRQCLESEKAEGRIVETLRRQQPEMPGVLAAIGRCHASGCRLDLRAIFPKATNPVALPFYPWQRARHWNGGVFGPPRQWRAEFQHPLLGYRSTSADPIWENEIGGAELSYLTDHRVLGATVFPMAGFVEMALKAAQLFRGTPAVGIEDLEVCRPLTLADGQRSRVQFSICPEDSAFLIRSRGQDAAAWALNASGRLAGSSGSALPPAVELDELRSRMTGHLSAAALYRRCEAMGLQYGPAFRQLEEVWAGSGEALGRLAAQTGLDQEGYRFHPALLDGCLHTAAAALRVDSTEADALYLPARIDRFRLFTEGRDAAFCHALVEQRGPRSVILHVRILDAEGATVAEAEGFRLRRVENTDRRSVALPLLEMRAVLQPAKTSRTGEAATLPDPAMLAQAVAQRLVPLVDDADPRRVRAWADEVCGLFAWEALETLGFSRSLVAPDQLALFERLVDMAVEDGLLLRRGDELALTGNRPARCGVEEWRRGVANFPGYLAEADLLGRCGVALAGVLRAPLIPEGGASAVEHLYDQAPSARVAHSTVRAAIAEVVRHWPEDRLLRVVEIGGDAGPLAPHILPLLAPGRTEYRSIRDIADRDFEERDFDIVLAAGAFHATPDPAGALRHARELIRGGGLLVLVEQQSQRFFDLVFGPLQLQGPEQWIERLAESGFEHATVLGGPQNSVAALSVVAAWNPPAQTEAVESMAAPATKRTCVVLREPGADALLEHLAERLAQAGHRVVQLLPGTAYERLGQDRFAAPVDDPEAFCRFFLELASEDIHCDELIHGWGFTRKLPGNAGELMDVTDRRCVSTLSLVQGLMRAEMARSPRLWLLTCGALTVSPRAGNECPAQGSLWGLGRVVTQEVPALACKLVDLHWKDNPSAVLDRLLTELDETGAEDEVILTERARYVHRARLSSLGERIAGERALEQDAAFRLALIRPGSPDNLVVDRCERPAPGPGQVEIRVHAAGLNFHDLMLAMGLLPDAAIETGFAGPTLGLECAGEVVRVGEGVAGFHAGGAVMASAPQCFSAYVLAPAAHTLPKPDGVGYEAAATVLTAFTTVVYSLEHLGRLQPGERVLIHGAAGGVGLAAIQYAMHVGAEVFATAGTEEKREFIRLLGVKHVFSSRTHDYAAEIMQATQGEGVDLVLNTLSGEAVARSFSVLRPFGRFLELGKRDFIAQNRMAMAPFRNNLSYFGIDLDQALAVRPGFRATILPRVVELMSLGVLRPLPFRSFPVSRAREAFRHMQKSQHIGKIVISFQDEDVRAMPLESAPNPIRPDGTYLVTGGLSGLGLETARWMAGKGARHLVLAGRSGVAAPEAAAAVSQLRDAGCDVLAASADVADESALRQLLAHVARRMPPLRGVVHAAMVLDDSMVHRMTSQQFWNAARPKILGSWNLHRLTLDAPLEFFVLYSSAATTLGTPGQANYVAGNLFLESLANYRRSLGLPGTAICWGAISDTGFLARNNEVLDTLESRLAVRPLSARQALRYLEQILGRGGANWIATDVNWPKLASMSPALVRSPRFAPLIGEGTGAPPAESGKDLRALLMTLPSDEVRRAVPEMLALELARVMGGSAARVHPDRPLVELGVDSLMAVELLTTIESRFHVQITPLEIMGGVTLSQIAGRISATVLAERDRDK